MPPSQKKKLKLRKNLHERDQKSKGKIFFFLENLQNKTKQQKKNQNKTNKKKMKEAEKIWMSFFRRVSSSRPTLPHTAVLSNLKISWGSLFVEAIIIVSWYLCQ